MIGISVYINIDNVVGFIYYSVIIVVIIVD